MIILSKNALFFTYFCWFRCQWMFQSIDCRNTLSLPVGILGVILLLIIISGFLCMTYKRLEAPFRKHHLASRSREVEQVHQQYKSTSRASKSSKSPLLQFSYSAYSLHNRKDIVLRSPWWHSRIAICDSMILPDIALPQRPTTGSLYNEIRSADLLSRTILRVLYSVF